MSAEKETWDVHQRSRDTLQDILDAEAERMVAPQGSQVPVGRARRGERVISVAVERTDTRVLFVTDDTDVVVPDSALASYYQKLARVFGEIHILLVHPGQHELTATRLAQNVFCYRVGGKYWWSRRLAARRAAREHLVFGSAIRPDVIVAASPYEPGLLAADLAKMLKRPWQVHSYVDPYDPVLIVKDPRQKRRRRLANRVFKKAISVRTSTDVLREGVRTRFPQLPDVALLPHHYDVASYRARRASFDLKERYNQYSFIVLADGELTADSPIHDVITGARSVVHNPRIGLIILGDGPARPLFIEKVKLLGLEENVVFATDTTDRVSYYAGADVFVEAATTRESEEHIIRATAASLPIITYQTPLRTDLFVDGESAFLCEPTDSYCLGQRLAQFLNTNRLRTQFRQRMSDIATYRLNDDEEAYLGAIRDSIEAVLRQGG